MFKVCKIQDHMFKFLVSSLDVGFAIYNGGNISIPEFNLGFLLWGRNGVKRRPISDPEMENGWTLVSCSRNNANSYADVVHAPRFFDQSRSIPPIARTIPGEARARSSVAVSTVFSRLQFPNNAGVNAAGNLIIQTNASGAIPGQNQSNGPSNGPALHNMN